MTTWRGLDGQMTRGRAGPLVYEVYRLSQLLERPRKSYKC